MGLRQFARPDLRGSLPEPIEPVHFEACLHVLGREGGPVQTARKGDKAEGIVAKIRQVEMLTA
jgi:hypothetical protein